MKINLLTFGFIAASAMMTACSSDELVADSGANGTKGDVYMSFTLVNTSDGARSRSETTSGESDGYGTSDAGVEIGTGVENTIKSVQIYLVQEDKSVASATVSSSNITTTTTDGSKTYVASFKSSDLEAKHGEKVDVMVYANFTEETYDKDKTNTGHSWGSENISEAVAGKFQMSNADTNYTVTIPDDLSGYTTETSPWDIGSIQVERAAARIDIASGGYNSAGEATTDNTYYLSDVVDNGSVTITLEEFALINMSQNWYAIRRVSSDAPLTKTSVTLAGTETATNWVVDTDWENKYSFATTENATADDVPSTFDYPLSKPDTWKYTAFKDLDREDTWNPESESESESKSSFADYKVWRYLNENTIPGADYQKHGISTGVVFKGKLESTNSDISSDMNNRETLYVFQNKLYGSIERVAECAKTDAALQYAFSQCVSGTAGSYTVDKEAAAKAGFTGYSRDSDDGNYYVYYYYWIRHNDNGEPSNMGTMEFAIVRNNVYKLQVTKIQKLGHPAPGDDDHPDPDPDPDPDPVTPDGPDEDDDVYFQVSMKVMPWVVRINNIEF